MRSLLTSLHVNFVLIHQPANNQFSKDHYSTGRAEILLISAEKHEVLIANCNYIANLYLQAQLDTLGDVIPKKNLENQPHSYLYGFVRVSSPVIWSTKLYM